MNRKILFTLFVALMLLASCAPGNAKFDVDPAGFWLGLWHGFIIVVSYIISLFNETWTIYEANNNGAWYNLGFIIGVAVFLRWWRTFFTPLQKIRLVRYYCNVCP